jgi:hypothetical protein
MILGAARLLIVVGRLILFVPLVFQLLYEVWWPLWGWSIHLNSSFTGWNVKILCAPSPGCSSGEPVSLKWALGVTWPVFTLCPTSKVNLGAGITSWFVMDVWNGAYRSSC